MAVSHRDCDHPATPSERAKCRRRREKDKPKLRRKPGMEADYAKRTGARVYEVREDPDRKGKRYTPVADDVVARAGKPSEPIALAEVILAKPENYHPDDVRRARQYLFGK